MNEFRLTLLALLALLVTLAVPAAVGAAAIDPERNLAHPVLSMRTTDQSEAEVNARAAEGWRLTDITVERQDPYRFAGVFVSNSGSYTRDWYWWYGKSSAEVEALTRHAGRRLIDVEPYTVNGQRRFAIVSVANEGEALKEWGWNSDLTAAQVTAEANRYGLRVVDLDAYVVNGQRLYSYVGVKNLGVDARQWWLYEDVRTDSIPDMLANHGARLVDIEWLFQGLGRTRVSVVMVHNPEGTFTLPVVGADASRLEELLASNGARIAELDRHGDRWTGILIDNVEGEAARLRSVVRGTLFGSGFFGVFAKRIGGPTYVGLAHQDGYQPMSVLKLLPHLHVMELLDKGKVDLGETIQWTTPIGEPEAVWCSGTSGSVHVATLREALLLSLWQSRNPVHEALLAKYGQQAIVGRVHALGLTGTQLYPSCEKPDRPNWLSNRTTLAEMGRLFELVDEKKVFSRNWLGTSNTFYDLMASFSPESFRGVVAEEAAKLGKSALVDTFISLIRFDGKPGSDATDVTGGRPRTIGRALSYRVTFPAKVPVEGGAAFVPVPVAHVGGVFVNRLYVPCLEVVVTKTGPSAVCRQREREADEALWKITAEAQRTAIREALETW